MFTGRKLMFTVRGLMFIDRELMFTVHKHKISPLNFYIAARARE